MRASEIARRMPEEMSAGAGPEIGFGAKRVGVLLDRLRLHLETDRFLAERRRDPVWEVGCDYAVLALGRLASRLRPSVRGASLVGEVAALRHGAGWPVMGARERSNLDAATRISGGRRTGAKDAALKGGATQAKTTAKTTVRRVLTQMLLGRSDRVRRARRALNSRKPRRSSPAAARRGHR